MRETMRNVAYVGPKVSQWNDMIDDVPGVAEQITQWKERLSQKVVEIDGYIAQDQQRLSDRLAYKALLQAELAGVVRLEALWHQDDIENQ